MTEWRQQSIYYQLGNIGSEIGRAFKWKGRDATKSQGAADRALELLDWSLANNRNRAYFKELARIREVFADSFFADNIYNQTLGSWDRYFFPYACVANKKQP